MRFLFVFIGLLTASGPVCAEARPAFHLLALSWQPAVCETLTHTPECRSQTSDRFDAGHFSLHGLWPQPRDQVYCGVDARTRTASENGRWDLLPETRLSGVTRQELSVVMPGARSLLDRHEWVKHGSCYFNRSAETYFRDALRLTDELNRSAVRSYFAAMIGKTVRLSDVRRRFHESFGDGAGLRVRLACRSDGRRRLITGITLGLVGDPSSQSLRELLLASRPTDGGCERGEVDEVGLQ